MEEQNEIRDRFTIKRSEWARGARTRSGAVNSLLRKDNKKCCLGIYAEHCGIELVVLEASPLDIVCRLGWEGTPANYRDLLVATGRRCERLDGPGRVGIFSNTRAAVELMAINDQSRISDKRREELLKEAFAAYGIEVEFVD